MEFKSLKNIETSFRQIRLFGIIMVCDREPQVSLNVTAYPLYEGILESVPDGDRKTYGAKYRQHYKEECAYGVDCERCGLEQHFKQLTEKYSPRYRF